MTVHSTQLAAPGILGSGTTTLYTVPAGKRTILKGLSLYNDSGGAQDITLLVESGSTVLAAIPFHMPAAGSAGAGAFFPLWIVLNAGQKIVLSVPSASVYVSASGAELLL